MNREEMKAVVGAVVDERRQVYLDLGERIYRTPETGYREVKTTKTLTDPWQFQPCIIRGKLFAILVSAADVAVANNTAALIVTADVAKEISTEYHVDPRRTASLMDIFCCVAQGFLPYGNQILLIGGLAAGTVAPVEILPYMWYVMLLGISAIISCYIPFADGTIRKAPWDWEAGKPAEKHE